VLHGMGPPAQVSPLHVFAATHSPPTHTSPALQQTPLQQTWVVGQQVDPPLQNAEPVGHWQVPLTQLVPPVQVLPQALQFWFVPREVQVPLQQPVP